MAHRGQPTCSKMLSAIWQIQANEQHEKRIKQVRSRVKNKAPPVYSHLVNRNKKQQQMEEKYTKIMYENQLLLKKMDNIWKKSSLDNNNEQFKGPRSLNASQRKKELLRIMNDNQHILRRITDRKGHLSRKTWQSHSKNHSRYLKGMEQQSVSAIIRKMDAKKKGKLPKGHRASKLSSKKGQMIDGRNVIVTVDEIKEPHALHFRTYNLDTTDQSEVKLPFNEIPEILIGAKSILKPERRGDLAKALLPRLHFRGKQLYLDKALANRKEKAVKENGEAQARVEDTAAQEQEKEKEQTQPEEPTKAAIGFDDDE